MKLFKITECPRDAMQGIKEFIPTGTKIDYLNTLLTVGFDHLDCGSFVSPKAIPQMSDTAEVLKGLKMDTTNTKLSVIVANARGAEEARHFEQVSFLGYPFSISETFQQRNTNASIEESVQRVEEIQAICRASGKELLIYISMAFGNPYGDEYHPEIVMKWINRLKQELGIRYFSLADTIGVSTPAGIETLFSACTHSTSGIHLSAHLHTTPDTWEEKIAALVKGGCTWYEGAIRGFGGCPMAKDDLTGNMPTEKMLDYFRLNSLGTQVQGDAFIRAEQQALHVFHA